MKPYALALAARLAVTLAATLAFTAGFSGPAAAGEQFVDSSGYAVSGYDVVAYRGLAQSEIGQSQPAAVPGKAAITAEYNGAVFAFSSEENRAEFVANPAYYAPQYDGHCAYGVSRGGKVPGNPHLWRIVDDKLYLNITENVAGFWQQDIPGNISLAETNWSGIEPDPASDNPIPNFTSPAPARN